jgi:hypothetical protein
MSGSGSRVARRRRARLSGTHRLTRAVRHHSGVAFWRKGDTLQHRDKLPYVALIPAI